MLSVTMPFGKHRDKLIAEIETDYLQWCLDNLSLGPSLKRAILDEMDQRGVWQPEHDELPFTDADSEPEPPPVAGIDPDELDATFVQWWRDMSSLCNGDESAYATLNLITEEFSRRLYALRLRSGVRSTRDA